MEGRIRCEGLSRSEDSDARRPPQEGLACRKPGVADARERSRRQPAKQIPIISEAKAKQRDSNAHRLPEAVRTQRERAWRAARGRTMDGRSGCKCLLVATVSASSSNKKTS